MAAFDTTRPATGSLFGGRLANLFGALIEWNDERVTRKALSKLTDRELDDIGLNRGDIETMHR